MDESEEKFGDVYGALSIVGKIALLAQWAPLLAKLEAVAVAKTPAEKAIAMIAAARLAADKTPTTKDNDILALFEAAIKTPEGEAIANWFAIVAQEIK
jgi:hypothetical protein